MLTMLSALNTLCEFVSKMKIPAVGEMTALVVRIFLGESPHGIVTSIEVVNKGIRIVIRVVPVTVLTVIRNSLSIPISVLWKDCRTI